MCVCLRLMVSLLFSQEDEQCEDPKPKHCGKRQWPMVRKSMGQGGSISE